MFESNDEQVQLWLEALDAAFAILNKDLLKDVAAVSVSAQQHGSVYWKSGASQTLANLQHEVSLVHNLHESFAISDCPIWADSSTHAYCQSLEEAVGGAERLAALTGSAAYERFTGPQIAKIVHERSAQWRECERVSLVSSFAASLLLQAYAPIDASDASGMNLMDLRTRQWLPAACACVAGAQPAMSVCHPPHQPGTHCGPLRLPPAVRSCAPLRRCRRRGDGGRGAAGEAGARRRPVLRPGPRRPVLAGAVRAAGRVPGRLRDRRHPGRAGR